MRAETTTFIVVRAKDGTMRDVAVSSIDSAEEIGRNVIDAIQGRRLFQLTTVRCDRCRAYLGGT